MLKLNVVIDNKKLNLKMTRMKRDVPAALKAGIANATMAIHSEADKNLRGPGAKVKTTGKAVRDRGKWKIKGRKDTPQSIPAGGYPVPVRTGNLRRLLGIVLPGERKQLGGVRFSAGKFTGIVFNSAIYADVIHEGKLTSQRHGKRPYLADAAENLNIEGFIEREIERAANG